MNTKQCAKCKITKPIDEFHNNSLSKCGKTSYCKKCAIDNAKLSYKRLYQKNKDKIYKRARQRALIFTNIVNDIKSIRSCIFCGENEPICLDFHHLDPTQKDYNISVLVQAKSRKIVDEIQKCVVVCSNCHRKVHANILNCKNLKSIILSNDEINKFDLKLRISKEKYTYKKNTCITCDTKIHKKSIRCSKCNKIYKRKQLTNKLPPLNDLEISVNNFGYAATGRKYNVSDNTIRKWIKILKI